MNSFNGKPQAPAFSLHRHRSVSRGTVACASLSSFNGKPQAPALSLHRHRPVSRGTGACGLLNSFNGKPQAPALSLHRHQPMSRGTVASGLPLNKVRGSLRRRRRGAASAVGKENRKGTVTVFALVTLLIVSAVMAQFVRRVLLERRQFRQEMLHQQAEKLADGGLQLALEAVARDPAWSGVRWEVPPGIIHQTNSGLVDIQMQEGTCTVVARYPANLDIPFQVTRTRKLTP